MGLFLTALLALTACGGGARVAFHNQSDARLTEVSITGGHESVPLGSIEPGDTLETSICPRGEAGRLDVAFTVNGGRRLGSVPLYFECGSSYKIRVSVSPAFGVSATSDLQ
jgi:hypothetical protein